jgi:putative mRNA 3-end processing factor
MRIRGTRRRRALDRGFVLSDHADWTGVLSAIDATGAERVLLSHGYSSVVARWLKAHGRDADIISTGYTGERVDLVEPAASADAEAAARPDAP